MGPQDNGPSWCNEDCVWVNNRCESKQAAGAANPQQQQKVPQPVPLPEARAAAFNNPKAQVIYNLTVVPTYEHSFVYWPGGEPTSRTDNCNFKLSPTHNRFFAKQCWLWAKPVEAGNHLTLVFENSIVIKEYLFEFGAEGHRKDIL